ncbi:MAG: mannosyltransferase family protein [Anaerolineae bacterium]|nr:mannosyltransferase family protein [Anaerolineae bacterium]
MIVGESPVIAFWLLVLISTRILGAMLSGIRPLTDLERSVPLWPPAFPLTRWLERALIAPWDRWDVEWYARIVTQGYQAGDGTTQFYPLYPLTAALLTRLGLPPIVALTLVSLAAGLGAMLLFERLARRDMDLIRARRATLAFMLFPAGIALFVPYSESMFLLGAIGSAWAARAGRWEWVGLLAAVATLTRPQGLFLLLLLGPRIWTAQAGGWRWMGLWMAFVALLRPRGLCSWLLTNLRPRTRIRRAILALATIPMALLLWHGYRILRLEGELPDVGAGLWIYVLLLSPHAHRVVPIQEFTWPWEAMRRALIHFIRAPDLDLAVNLSVALLFLTLTGLAWGRMDGGERLYTAAVVLSALSYHTGPVHPYMGLPRHLWIAFPVFLGLGRRGGRTLQVLPALEMPGLLFLAGLFVLHAWVP